ncbi:MAG: RHS repeat-associated core domain-containing protein [Chloroflexota bacterium]|nr:RHS repeat-associated core domain-containing protein [Chloroflexota bacterium]
MLDLQPGLAVVLRTTGTAFNEHYIHAGRGILAQQTYSDWSWAVQDGLGSVRGMIDNSANVVGYANYDSFGNVTASNSTAGFPYGFTGEWHDFAVSVYLRARHYDPTIGIFTSRDPFEGMAGRPISLNGYSWVEGNVVNAVDPSGMQVPVPAPGPGGVIVPFVQPIVSPISVPNVSGAQSAAALQQSELIRLAVLAPINPDFHRYVSEVFGFCPVALPDRELESHETNCLQGRRPEEAAIDYAWAARFYHQSVFNAVQTRRESDPERYGTGQSTGIVVAFTEVKLKDLPLCVRLAAMNNKQEDSWTQATVNRWYLGRDLFILLTRATGTLAHAPDLLQLNITGTPGQPVAGHAEANLQSLVQFPAFDQSSFRAIGISTQPCDDNPGADCSSWLRGSMPQLSVAYFGTNVPVVWH